MLEKVIEIVAKYQGIDVKDLSEDTNLVTDLGLSSFDIVSLICEFENEFGLEVPDSELRDVRTIGDITKVIESLK